jgi:hypothetical protein
MTKKRPSVRAAWVFAIVGFVTTPLLLFFELTSLFLVAMILYEPSNPVIVKVLFVIGVIGIAALGLLLPLFAVFSEKAIGPRVIAGISIAGWLVAQLYYIGMATGLCSFEGCFPA